MKSALILSGDLRNFRDCFSSLESNVLNYNQIDVYMHCYDCDEVNEAESLYRPKKMVVDKRDDNICQISKSCFENKAPETDPHSMFCMWKNVKKSFDLMEERYDVVLKTRYDVKYCSPLKLNEFDTHFLWVPEGGDWRGGLFDMMSFSSHDNMRGYCSLIDSLNKYSEAGVPCHPEIMLKYHVQNSKIALSRFDYTVLLRRKFDRPWIEDKVFTLRS